MGGLQHHQRANRKSSLLGDHSCEIGDAQRSGDRGALQDHCGAQVGLSIAHATLAPALAAITDIKRGPTATASARGQGSLRRQRMKTPWPSPESEPIRPARNADLSNPPTMISTGALEE
jgi:hypothetical protein